MAAVRNFSRLLTQKSLNRLIVRGYADEMSFTFAAGNKIYYENAAIKQVDVPSFSGVFGILPKHVPTLAVLKPGLVSIYENDGKVNKIFVSSGTVTVNDDSSVQIIAEEAASIDQIDPNAAKEVLNQAMQEISAAKTPEERAEAEIAVEVAQEIIRAIQ